VGNEAVVIFRIRVGKQSGSAALIADGYHARTDGWTSLAVLVGAAGVHLGYPLADPIVGLVITAAILAVVWGSVKMVFARVLDGVDPEVIDRVHAIAGEVPGVTGVTDATLKLADGATAGLTLHTIDGTPLGKRRDFSPTRGLKILCLMRFLNPRSEVRMAAGRELYLSGWSGLVLYPANSIFVEGYLTTSGQQARDAHRLVEDAGFEVEQVEMQAAAL